MSKYEPKKEIELSGHESELRRNKEFEDITALLPVHL